MRYRPEIDGLRAVAVVPVILFHAGFSVFSGGYVGVDIFFVISGYLITHILIEELRTESFSILRFYERRARRILPALFLVMATTIPFAWFWMLPEQLVEFGNSLVAVSLFVSNILFWFESGYFAPAAEAKPLLHTWSLAVEEQYYVFFPIFLFFAWRLGTGFVMASLVVISIISILTSEWGWRNEPNANFYLMPSRIWELLAGSLGALVMSHRPTRPNDILSLFGFALIAVSMFYFNDSTPFPSLYTLAPVGGSLLIILFSQGQSGVGKVLASKLAVWIGLVSYSAYLWHQPLFAFARSQNVGPVNQLLIVGLTIFTFFLAYLTWRFIEQPFRIKGGISLVSRKMTFICSAIAGIVMIGTGTMLSRNKGYEYRMPSAYFDNLALLETAIESRASAIRSGECQYNGLGNNSGLDEFIAQWDCGPAKATDGGNVLAVFGDSHSADKAAALRLNGIDIMQVGGAGCPLLPQAGRCGALLDMFHTQAQRFGITTVFLGNSFTPEELTPAYLSALMEYWASKYDRVVLFTPVPSFAGLEAVFLRRGLIGVGAIEPDTETAAVFAQSINLITVPDNVIIVDSQDAFCQERNPCSAVQNSTLLVVDEKHLSEAGARLVGRRIANLLQL